MRRFGGKSQLDWECRNKRSVWRCKMCKAYSMWSRGNQIQEPWRLGEKTGMQREFLGVQDFLGHISPPCLLGFGVAINTRFLKPKDWVYDSDLQWPFSEEGSSPHCSHWIRRVISWQSNSRGCCEIKLLLKPRKCLWSKGLISAYDTLK